MNQHFRPGPRPSLDPEHLTYAGALKLASRLRDYWAEKGKSPSIEVIRETGVKSARAWDRPLNEDPEHPGVWVVRSNMVAGWPV